MTNDQIFKLIGHEVDLAEMKHPTTGTPRHGHSVIEEEYDEFWEAIKADDLEAAFKEATQLAATCVRYMKAHAPSSVRLFH